jgi:hypothetical protein
MPVRKIPKNHLTVTGGFASRKNGEMGSFESLLEKEYMLLLDLDDGVESFEEQPVNIPVPGVRKGYTPDLLVHFQPDPITGHIRKPFLAEVKHSDEKSFQSQGPANDARDTHTQRRHTWGHVRSG